jgi:hypothetical protein
MRVRWPGSAPGIIDLTGVNGYYTFLAMVLNTARTAVPKNAPMIPLFPR